MRGTRVAITLFFFADGLLLGSWAARIPAVQHHDGPDEHAARRRAVRGVAGSARRDAGGGLAVRAHRQPPRHRRRAARRRLRRCSPPRSRAASRGLAAALVRVRRGLRRDQRVGERAGPRTRAAVRPLDPLLVPRGVQRRRARGRRASARSRRRRASARGRTSGRVALVLALDRARGGRLFLPPRRRSADRHATLVRPPRALLVLGAAAFFTLLAEGAAADWSAVYLSRLARCDGRRGRARLHRLLARDGDEPARRRPPERALRPGGARARRAGCSPRPGWRSALVERLDCCRARRFRGHGRGARRHRAGAVPRRGFDARRVGRRRRRCRLDDRLAGFPRRSTRDRVCGGCGRGAGRALRSSSSPPSRWRFSRASAVAADARRPRVVSSRAPCCRTSTACSSTPARRSRRPGGASPSGTGSTPRCRRARATAGARST